MMALLLSFLLVGLTAMAQVPFSQCPDSPNCVSSLVGEDESHKVAPFDFKGSLEESQSALKRAITEFERATLVSETPNHWKCEFRTKILGFVDDVEFFFDADLKKIHVRSASRVGYSDLGTNRKRIEKLRELYSK